MMKSPLEIASHAPKNNFGRCGHPACLAFAVNIVKGLEDPQNYLYLRVEELELEPIKQKASESEYDEEHDLALIKHLKSKIAPQTGANLSFGNTVLFFNYLRREINLFKADSADPLDYRDQILRYNYVYFSGAYLSNEWIGMESMPNSISKVLEFLDIEALVFSSEQLAERLEKQPAFLTTI